MPRPTFRWTSSAYNTVMLNDQAITSDAIAFPVVEAGAIEIVNPADENRHIVTHGPGQFAGDIDLLTRRPVIVTGIARGPTRLLRVPGARLRELLNKAPQV